MLDKHLQIQGLGENAGVLFLCLDVDDADLPFLYRIANDVVFDVDMPRPATRVLLVG